MKIITAQSDVGITLALNNTLKSFGKEALFMTSHRFFFNFQLSACVQSNSIDFLGLFYLHCT